MNWVDKKDDGMTPGTVSNTETATGTFPDELIIATVPVVGKAVIGIIPCPGRNQTGAVGTPWHRELEADLKALEAWNTQMLVSLVEPHEFSQLGVTNFIEAVQHCNFRWHHLPITDMAAPSATFQEAWNTHGSDILRSLEHGERVVIHCAGGLGRSGMIAAKLLTVFGVSPDEAIAKVREARPGAIETRVQETYVLTGPSLADQPFGI
jgi:ADP-ribosyl-[dinitrogen reductase] hydrolase